MIFEKYALSVCPGDVADMVEDNEHGGYYEAADIDPMINYILNKGNCGQFCDSPARLCDECIPDGRHFKPVWNK